MNEVLFAWPMGAHVGSRVPKEKFVGGSKHGAGVRTRFVSEVERVTWAYKLAETGDEAYRRRRRAEQGQVCAAYARCALMRHVRKQADNAEENYEQHRLRELFLSFVFQEDRRLSQLPGLKTRICPPLIKRR